MMQSERRKRWLFSFLGLAGALAVLCACGNSAPEQALPPIDETLLRDDSVPSYPLSQVLYGAIDPDQSEARRLDIEHGQEQILVDCMRDAGFEYSPRSMSAFTYSQPTDEASYLDWVGTYGFGITTRYFAQSQVGDLVGEPDHEVDERQAASVDPNQTYLESLSASERNAYDLALKGFTSSFRPQSAFEEALMDRPDGCLGESTSWVEQQQGPSRDELLRDRLDSEIEEMIERAAADPRMTEFDENVRSCVAEQGFMWPGESELSLRFEPELAAIAAALEKPDDDRRSAPLGPQALALLAELQADELNLARVVHDCGGGQRNQTRFGNAVWIAYEREFVDQNADVLAEIVTG